MHEVSEDGAAHGLEEDRSASYRHGRGLAGGLAGAHAGGCSTHISRSHRTITHRIACTITLMLGGD
jgi:hypothetical protein